MKRIVLILALIIICFQCNAQHYPPFDTIIVFSPPQLNGCPMVLDSNTNRFGSSFSYWQTREYWCHNHNCVGPSGGVVSSNTYGIEGVAQPYHLDSTMLICGIATHLKGSLGIPNQGKCFFRLLDTSFNTLAKATLYEGSTNPNVPYDDNQLKKYYFDTAISIKDFYLAVDIGTCESGFAIQFNHTCSVFDTCLERVFRSFVHPLPYDTILVGYNYFHPDDSLSIITDTLVCCQSDESPWFKKDGQWIRFADDSVYDLYQKTFIEFLPLIMIQNPDTSSLLSELELENTCNIYPNPSKNILNLISQFKVKHIEIYNILGVKVKEMVVNNYESKIDISTLPRGSYIIKLFTVKGSATKKFIVE